MQEHVSVRTVERWIEKGLPADPATRGQIGQLFSLGLLKAIPSHQTIYLIHQSDLRLIPEIRAYPTGTMWNVTISVFSAGISVSGCRN